MLVLWRFIWGRGFDIRGLGEERFSAFFLACFLFFFVVFLSFSFCVFGWALGVLKELLGRVLDAANYFFCGGI